MVYGFLRNSKNRRLRRSSFRSKPIIALQTMKTKQAAAHVAAISGLSKQELYKQALKLKDDI